MLRIICDSVIGGVDGLASLFPQLPMGPHQAQAKSSWEDFHPSKLPLSLLYD